MFVIPDVYCWSYLKRDVVHDVVDVWGERCAF